MERPRRHGHSTDNSKHMGRQQPRAASSSGDNIAAARDDEIGCEKQPVQETAKPGQQSARFVIIEGHLDAEQRQRGKQQKMSGKSHWIRRDSRRHGSKQEIA